MSAPLYEPPRNACGHSRLAFLCAEQNSLWCSECASLVRTHGVGSTDAPRVTGSPVLNPPAFDSLAALLRLSFDADRHLHSVHDLISDVIAASTARLVTVTQAMKDEVDTYLLNLVRGIQRAQTRLHAEIDQHAEEQRQKIDALKHIRDEITSTCRMTALLRMHEAAVETSSRLPATTFALPLGEAQVLVQSTTLLVRDVEPLCERARESILHVINHEESLDPQPLTLDAMQERRRHLGTNFDLRFRKEFISFDLQALTIVPTSRRTQKARRSRTTTTGAPPRHILTPDPVIAALKSSVH